MELMVSIEQVLAWFGKILSNMEQRLQTANSISTKQHMSQLYMETYWWRTMEKRHSYNCGNITRMLWQQWKL